MQGCRSQTDFRPQRLPARHTASRRSAQDLLNLRKLLILPNLQNLLNLLDLLILLNQMLPLSLLNPLNPLILPIPPDLLNPPDSLRRSEEHTSEL